ncbi:hypothetical protein K1719_038061 [Acacia pycnantha]|nr:hypothetical protein K1719_038061 [Acacia pycnantha]
MVLLGSRPCVAKIKTRLGTVEELVLRPSLKMKGPQPQYLSGIPDPPAKCRKRSAGDAGKSKVGESSKPAESKKHRVGPSTDATPASVIPASPIRSSPIAVMPPPKSAEAGPSSLQTTSTLPRPPTVLPRSLLWSKGITEELSITLLPPPRYQEPVPLLEADVRDVQAAGHAFLRGAGLTQAFLTLHHKYVEAAADMKRARTERDEALKQWQIASNEFQAREVQTEKVEFARKKPGDLGRLQCDN